MVAKVGAQAKGEHERTRGAVSDECRVGLRAFLDTRLAAFSQASR